jgi:hypothetical protein
MLVYKEKNSTSGFSVSLCVCENLIHIYLLINWKLVLFLIFQVLSGEQKLKN